VPETLLYLDLMVQHMYIMCHLTLPRYIQTLVKKLVCVLNVYMYIVFILVLALFVPTYVKFITVFN